MRNSFYISSKNIISQLGYDKFGIDPPTYESNPVFIPVQSFVHGANENEVYWFHPDHLGSTSYITNLLGEVSQHMEYFAFGETFVEEHRSSNNSPYKFNGKELDEETGWYYYGARYYDPRISVWLSVDPLASFDPIQNSEHYIDGEHNGGVFNSGNLSVYGYTYQNPVFYVDPNGKQSHWATYFMNEKEKKEFEAHWPMVEKRGGSVWLMRNANKYRTITGRFMARAATFESNDPVLQKNGPDPTDPDRGSDAGAARHALWSAILANKEGRDGAQIIADAHEGYEMSSVDSNEIPINGIKTLFEADRYVDELNNRLGRNYGIENKGKGYKALAFGILKLFREEGLFTLEQGDGGTYNIIRRNITEKQYNALKERFETLSNDGKDERDAQK